MPPVLVSETGDLEFKPFRETYKIITFTMVVGLLYPTPETAVCRVVGFGRPRITLLFYLSAVLLVLSVTPLYTVVLLDMWSSWQRQDIINIIRHITVLGPLLAAIFKITLFFFSRADTWCIINKIDADHARYNTLPKTHKVIARRHIQNSQYFSEKCWSITVATTVLIFPLTAVVQTFYNFAFKDEPTKYMVHDLDKPFSPREDRYSTPYFEIMFVYMMYVSMFYIVSFTGFDAFFGLSINHICMKMELACQTMEDAMLERDRDSRKRRMLDVIAEQNDIFKLVPLSPKFSSDDGIHEELRELFKNSRETYSDFSIFSNKPSICIQKVAFGEMELVRKTTDGHPKIQVFHGRRMVELVQTAFNYWLGIIVIATIFQICNCVYQITEGFGIDPRYLIFILGTVAHIFTPCQYAAKLQVKGLDVATRLYCCGWERVRDNGARKMITFMIARAQVPIRITAFNKLNFDMELFVSILHTSYSMFTLMRS